MIAVTGSGEYLSGIIDADLKLLSKLKTRPNVLTLPTAAGKESSDRINYWCDLATTHFSKFDVDHKNIKALKHNDFFDEELLDIIKSANFIYFSGGNRLMGKCMIARCPDFPSQRLFTCCSRAKRMSLTAS